MTLQKFVGRRNIFAKQLDTGGYVPVRATITDQDLQDHLDGTATYGTYTIKEDGTVMYGVVDIDSDPKDIEIYNRLGEQIYSLFPEFSRTLEFSGKKGFHVWIFFGKPESPRFVQELIKSRLKKVGIQNVEIFPKQTKLTGKKVGNLVKLPLGIHRISGKRSYILKEDIK